MVGPWGGGFGRNTEEGFVTDDSSAAVPWEGQCKNSWDFYKVTVTLVAYFCANSDLRDREQMGLCGADRDGEDRLSTWAKLALRVGSCLPYPQNYVFYLQSTQWSCHGEHEVDGVKFFP